MPTKLDLNAPNLDAFGRLAEAFDTHPVGAVLVTVFVLVILLSPALSVAIARRRQRRR